MIKKELKILLTLHHIIAFYNALEYGKKYASETRDLINSYYLFYHL